MLVNQNITNSALGGGEKSKGLGGMKIFKMNYALIMNLLIQLLFERQMPRLLLTVLVKA